MLVAAALILLFIAATIVVLGYHTIVEDRYEQDEREMYATIED